MSELNLSLNNLYVIPIQYIVTPKQRGFKKTKE